MTQHPSFALLYGAVALYVAGLAAHAVGKTRLSWAAVATGLVAHTGFQIGLARRAGFFFPAQLVQTGTFVSWCVALVILVKVAVSRNKRRASSALWVLCPMAAFAAVQAVLAEANAVPFAPPLPTNPWPWVVAFFGIESLAFACFFVGAWSALLHFAGQDKGEGFNSYLVAAFVLYSVAQIVGATWCYLGWGVPFHLGSQRHFRSAAVWLFLALCVHLRFAPGWETRRRAAVMFGSAPAVFLLQYVLWLG
jgi:hypothetical protein